MNRHSRANLHYAIGLTVLTAAAVGIQTAKAKGWLYIIKGPLPIQKPLKDLDREALAPFEVIEMAPLSTDLIQELGTKEYTNLILREPSRRRGANSEITLSITYYTNMQDQVPHVPEECIMQGGNFTPAGDTSLVMHMDSLNEDVAIRRLAFFPVGEMVRRSYFYYTIAVNGTLCSHRDVVRRHMADPRDTHLYYSKVEISYRDVLLKDEAALDEKARRLMDKVLSELMKSHWPPRGSERGGMPASPPQAGRN